MRPPYIAMFLVTLMLFTVLPATTGTEPEEPINTPPSCSADRENWTMGVVFCNGNATTGYTLFAPIPGNTTYLIDHEGRYLHEWVSPGNHRPALSAYLLPDGSLLRTANTASTAVGNFSGGGTGGKCQRRHFGFLLGMCSVASFSLTSSTSLNVFSKSSCAPSCTVLTKL